MKSIARISLALVSFLATASATAQSCVFPGTQAAAPAWICDEPPAGFSGFWATGSGESAVVALVHALAHIASRLKTTVTPEKQTSVLALGRISLTSEVRPNELTQHFRINAPGCSYDLKNHIRTQEKTDTFDSSLAIVSANCELKDLFKELDAAGARILNETYEPTSRQHYVRVGYAPPVKNDKRSKK